MSVRWYENDGKPHAQGRLPGRPTDQPWFPIAIDQVTQAGADVQIVYRRVEVGR